MQNPIDIGKFLTIAKEYTGSGNIYLNRYLREQDVLTTNSERDEHTRKFAHSQEFCHYIMH